MSLCVLDDHRVAQATSHGPHLLWAALTVAHLRHHLRGSYSESRGRLLSNRWLGCPKSAG
jgi:hypothetical protein